MSIPGFRAEGSLYRTGGHYRVAAAGDSARAGRLLPQQPFGGLSDRFDPNRPVPSVWWSWFDPNRPVPSVRCLLTYDRCTLRCAGLGYPDGEICRFGCSFLYQRCVAGHA